MKYEWNKKKDELNQNKHNISFSEAIGIFNGAVFTSIDDRKDYKEVREVSIGQIEGTVTLVVVHTDRKNVKRIISARKAKQKERRKYYEYLQKTSQ
jgi:uncharacterized protein